MTRQPKSGTADVRLVPGSESVFTIQYRSEADLRRSLADLACLYGWSVEEEVVVPGWGRIDLVLRRDVTARPYLVELKLALRKPSEVRRGFQQADGYGRWWTKERSEANTPLLVAAAPDMSIVTPVADAYPAVPFRTIGAFMNGLCNWDLHRERFTAASLDVGYLREQLARYERALAHLSTLLRRADEASAHAEYAQWIADGSPASAPAAVDF